MALLAESAVDWDAVLDVIWSSAAAGVGVTAIFALAILGATRAVEHRRDGHAFAASAYAVLMALSFAAVVAAVVFGVVVMTQK